VEGLGDEVFADVLRKSEEGDAFGIDPRDGMVLEIGHPAIRMMDGAKNVSLLGGVLQKAAESVLEPDHIDLAGAHHQDIRNILPLLKRTRPFMFWNLIGQLEVGHDICYIVTCEELIEIHFCTWVGSEGVDEGCNNFIVRSSGFGDDERNGWSIFR